MIHAYCCKLPAMLSMLWTQIGIFTLKCKPSGAANADPASKQ
jgi:hypothetical protein